MVGKEETKENEDGGTQEVERSVRLEAIREKLGDLRHEIRMMRAEDKTKVTAHDKKFIETVETNDFNFSEFLEGLD